MSAGYSGTPLVRKLGIRAGDRVALLHAPVDFTYDGLAESVDVRRDRRGTRPYDVIHAFFRAAAPLRREFPHLAARLTQSGALWISWPKKASGELTDLTGDVVRRTGLDAGLVDVKVCAVDATWSGLKFVIRKRDRI